LLERVEALVAQSRTIAHAAQQNQQWVSATSALREVRCCLELLGKLTGELSSSTNFNFNFLSSGGTLREEHLIAFLDAIEKRGGEATARLLELVRERFGPTAPIINVSFVAASAERAPLTLLDGHAPANGHA
jgi:hypothetical protein